MPSFLFNSDPRPSASDPNKLCKPRQLRHFLFWTVIIVVVYQAHVLVLLLLVVLLFWRFLLHSRDEVVNGRLYRVWAAVREGAWWRRTKAGPRW
jgi:hypothetical protein